MSVKGNLNMKSGHRTRCRWLWCAVLAWVSPVLGATGPSGQAVPSNAFSYARTTKYQYNDPQAYLTDIYAESDDAQSCLYTQIGYDSFGNRISIAKQNCPSAITGASAAGDAVIAARTDHINYANLPGQSGIVAGQYPYQVSNALSQSHNLQYDIRFGAVTQDQDPNSLAVQRQYDAFGRVVLETAPDGTKAAWTYAYCSGFDPRGSSFGVTCPAATSGTLVSVTTRTPQDKNGAQSGPPQRTYYDTVGRVARTETLSFDGTHWIVKAVGFDSVGRATQSAEPYLDTSPPTIAASSVVWTTTQYDVLNRPNQINKPDPTASATGGVAVTTISYQDLTTVMTNADGQSTSETRNSLGQVVLVTDAAGGELVRQFDAFGNLVTTIDQLGNTSTANFDIRGRLYAVNDPDLGAWMYGLDVLGQSGWQQSPNQAAASKKSSSQYDLLGRMTQRVVDEFTSTWTYDHYANASACSNGIGRLCEAATTQGDDRKYVFDSFGRVQTETLAISGGPSFTATSGYDATTGRLSGTTYPTGFAVSYLYNSTGYLSQLNNTADGTMIWQANRFNGRSQLELQTDGNNVQTLASFDPTTGRIGSIQVQPTGGTTGSLLNLSMTWDPLSNLQTRVDANGDGTGVATSESFTYDVLYRVKSYTVASPAITGGSRAVSMNYDAIGDITSKSDVAGTYSYPPSGPGSLRPHAVSSVGSTSYGYDANGNMTTASAGLWRSVAYTSFNLPTTSANGGLVSAAGVRYTWRYGPYLQRLQEIRAGGSGTRTTWFFHPDNVGGLFFEQETEADGSVVNRHYIRAAGQVVGIFASVGAGSSVITRKDYWHTDHLGSVVGVTGPSATLTQRYAYDPFGKRRFADGNADTTNALFIDWTHYADQSAGGTISTTSAGSSRGFTGHESMDDVGLIHMNGRLYEATIARFMQADPTMQFDRQLQNYNRYSYTLNNPLNAFDPSGFEDVPSGITVENHTYDPPKDSCSRDPSCIVVYDYRWFASGGGSSGSQAPGNAQDSNSLAGASPDSANNGSAVALTFSNPLVDPPKPWVSSHLCDAGSICITAPRCPESIFCYSVSDFLHPNPFAFDSALFQLTRNDPDRVGGKNAGKLEQKPQGHQPNPCSGAGNAPSPSQFAAQGQAGQQLTQDALNSGDPDAEVNATLANLYTLSTFRRGGALDAQAFGSSAGYANYVYGVYMQANGWSLPEALSGANLYASVFASYPASTPMSPNYPSTPAVNVTNITAGFNAQLNGSTCGKH